MTDMELVKGDWPLITGFGILYMFANGLGKLDCGVYIYPILDWENIPFTIFGWTMFSIAMAGLFYGWAHLHSKWRANHINK